MDGIIRRIERGVGIPGLSRILSDDIAAPDLQSLLMAVFRRRAAARRPDALLDALADDRFVRPSRVSPLALNAWEQLALAHCGEQFEAIELSPLAPLGTNLVTSGVSQDWAVTTIRRNEVVSDPTNVLAIEAALRRRALLAGQGAGAPAVHLAASHRVVRPQLYAGDGQLSHFRLFALVSSGRDSHEVRFGAVALARHVDLILGLLNEYFARMVPLQVAWSLPADMRPGADNPQLVALGEVAAEYGAELTREADRTGAGSYYAGFCFHVNAYSTAGRWVQVADGGQVDWGRRLLDNKERMVISGIGSERTIALHQEIEV